MPEATERRNTAPGWGLLLALSALGCNAAFFFNAPLRRIVPWLSLSLVIAAAILLAIGLRRALSRRIVYRGKIFSVALCGVAFLVAAFAALAFIGARKLPSADAAPQVGQKVPDFMLADTSGKAVSLDQLFAALPASAPSVPASSPAASPPSPLSQLRTPKAVLLIFYRGYW